MSDCRAGRVNALAFAILDSNGDADRLSEQMRFFRDLTDNDVDHALMLAHWVKTTGGPQLVRRIVQPLGVEIAPESLAATAVPA